MVRCLRFFFFFFELSKPRATAAPPTLPAPLPLPPPLPPLPKTESESRSISQLMKPKKERQNPLVHVPIDVLRQTAVDSVKSQEEELHLSSHFFHIIHITFCSIAFALCIIQLMEQLCD